MEEYLTPKQAAERKDISVQAIYKAVSEGRLTATQWMGRIGLKPEDIDAYEPGTYGGVQRAKKPRGPRKQVVDPGAGNSKGT